MTPASPSSCVIEVEGMSCSSCARAIEQGVARLPGVRRAEVNFALKTLSVSGDEAASPRAIVEALRDLGYDGHLPRRDAGDDLETRGLAVRLAITSFFAMNSMLPAAVVYFGMAPASAERPLALASAALAAPALIYGGSMFYRRAWAGLWRGIFGMDLLVTVGVLATVFASGIALRNGLNEVYFDTASMIVAFLLVGRLLEALARRRGASAVQALRALVPPLVRRLRGDREECVMIKEIRPGDRVRVGAGERIPVDGQVLEGRSDVEASLLTGEWRPVPVGPGAIVRAGTRNGQGVLDLEVERALGERTVDRIARDVEALLGKRAPLQALADRAGGWLTGIVLTAAALTSVVLWARGLAPPQALLRGVAVVVIACPCALGLATPMALVVAVGRAASRGLLFRDADAIERAAIATEVFVDKTGTLTEGRPVVASVQASQPGEEGAILALASRIEQGVEHPYARALRDASPPARLAGAAKIEPGRGVVFTTNEGDEVVLGQPRWLQERGISVPSLERSGRSVVAVARQGRWLGTILLEDQPHAGSREALDELRSMGLRLTMLTGDEPDAAERVAFALRFQGRVRASLLPSAKANELLAAQRQGQRTIFVGDGLNDGPALAAAHLGVAVQGATEVASAAAHLVLLGGGLRRLPEALKLARETRRVMVQNLAWAAGYNVLAIPAAMTGLVTPVWAALLMALSSISVVLNALRLSERTSSPTSAGVSLSTSPEPSSS